MLLDYLTFPSFHYRIQYSDDFSIWSDLPMCQDAPYSVHRSSSSLFNARRLHHKTDLQAGRCRGKHTALVGALKSVHQSMLVRR